MTQVAAIEIRLRSLLVGGAITILKNMSQWEGLSHILWQKHMFETTNQLVFSYHVHLLLQTTPKKINE